MAEKTEKTIVELKKEDRDLLRSVIDGIEERAKAAKPAAPTEKLTETPSEKHEHWKADDLLGSDCPECREELEKIGKQYMKKTLTDRKDPEAYPEECVECGTPVKREEEECPTCGGKQSRNR